MKIRKLLTLIVIIVMAFATTIKAQNLETRTEKDDEVLRLMIEDLKEQKKAGKLALILTDDERQNLSQQLLAQQGATAALSFVGEINTTTITAGEEFSVNFFVQGTPYSYFRIDLHAPTAPPGFKLLDFKKSVLNPALYSARMFTLENISPGNKTLTFMGSDGLNNIAWAAVQVSVFGQPLPTEAMNGILATYNRGKVVYYHSGLAGGFQVNLRCRTTQANATVMNTISQALGNTWTRSIRSGILIATRGRQSLVFTTVSDPDGTWIVGGFNP